MNRVIIHNKKRTLGILPIVLLLLFGFGMFLSNFSHPKVRALSGSDFQAGRIIDNAVFTDKTTMSVSDIQRFLSSKVPTCDTNGTGDSGHWNSSAGRDYTRAEWGSLHGYPAPFTCLKDYVENTTTLASNASDPNTSVPGGIGAAQIIYNAAQSYGINPEVILTTLQKEQGLVTDSWPWENEYNYAMGYGCPDTAGCSTTYKGFFKQVDAAAWQFRYYMDHLSQFNYQVGNYFVKYNPDSSCGGSVVNIQNAATAALYIYTPYQPNAAALNNLSGNGDSCSAYGNRNFWVYFNQWFGTTYAANYYATYYSQSNYPTIAQRQSANITLKYLNNGNAPWYDSTNAAAHYTEPITLAASNPINRGSEFYVSGDWTSASRPRNTFTAVYESDGTTLAPDQHTVQPGEVASYTFPVQAQSDTYPGTYNEYFMPIREGAPGASWFIGGDTVHMVINVTRATKAQFYSESTFPTVHQNEESSMSFMMKNVGSTVWYDSTNAGAHGEAPVVLAGDGPINRVSPFNTTGWTSQSRPVTAFTAVYESDGTTLAADQHTVQPGQVAKFSFNIVAKINQPPGVYREYFSLIREGARDWPIDAASVYEDVTVQQSNIQASYSYQSNYPTVTKGQSGNMFFRLKNTGNTNWYDDASWLGGIFPVHFATSWPVNRGSIFGSNWMSASRPTGKFAHVYEADNSTLAADQHVVKPGQIAEFNFSVNVPGSATSGAYPEHFQPVVEGAPGFSWYMDGIVWQQVTVQ